MRFKALKNFSIGKLKDKNRKDKPEDEELPNPQISKIKDKVEEETNDNAKAGENLQESPDAAGITLGAHDIPIRPHGPAAELSLEPEDPENDDGLTLDELENDSITLGEEVKISEVTAEKAAASKEPPAAEVATPTEIKPEENEVKPEDNDSLNNLFSDDEEEENPLANLITSLPDVSVRELMDDLEEIKRIIQEWKTGVK